MSTPHVENEERDLRELRLSKGKTQGDLGSQQLLSQYENGHLLPGARMIAHLAQELCVSTEVVFAACLESRRRASAPAPATEHPAAQ